MNLLTIKHLEEENVGTIYIANRSVEKFKEIQNLYDNIEYVEYKDRYNILKEDKIDIVISATSSPHLVIKKEDLPNIKDPIYFMDLALPRDIDFKIKELENANVYCIDDLKAIQNKNDNERIKLSKEAYKIIKNKIDEFMDNNTIIIDTKGSKVGVINGLSVYSMGEYSLNKKCADIKEDTLDYIFRKIDLNQRDKKILDKMLSSALKRMIREPILNLKHVKNKGKREEYIKAIEELFDI